MTIRDHLTLLYAKQAGLKAEIEFLEDYAEPLSLFPNNVAKVPPPVDPPAILSREECIAVLRQIDPEFESAGATLDGLRRRIAEVMRQELQATLQNHGPISPDAFRPAGIDPSPGKLALASQLEVWFHDTMKTNEDVVIGYQTTMDCDLRCRRPGGSCPMVSVCANALLDKGE